MDNVDFCIEIFDKWDKHHICNIAYIVARGAKPLYIWEGVSLKDIGKRDVKQIRQTLEDLINAEIREDNISKAPIAFSVYNRSREALLFGIASRPWIIKVYRWLMSVQLPDNIWHAIHGCLLGYDSTSIQKFIDSIKEE